MEYNKKEQLFDKINGLRLTSTNASDTLYNRGVVDAFRRTNEFFDEELIPEVPQYVIDWYEENKDDFEYNLWEWFNYDSDKGNRKNKEFYLWLNSCLNEPVETLVKMKLFGYKLKEEKKYSVKIKGVVENSSTLKHNTELDKWYMGRLDEFEGVEVEEVTK